jgi:hypothetical protein
LVVPTEDLDTRDVRKFNLDPLRDLATDRLVPEGAVRAFPKYEFPGVRRGAGGRKPRDWSGD